MAVAKAMMRVLAGLVLLAACSSSDLTLSDSGSGRGTDEGPAERSTTVPDATDPVDPDPTTTTMDDGGTLSIEEAEEIAFAAVFTEDDLSADWTECCPPLFGTPEELAGNIFCGVHGSLPAALARFQRTFAFKQGSDGSMQGRLTVSATVNATEEAAVANLDAVGTPEYIDCTTETAVDSVRELYRDPAAEGSATYEQIELPIGEQGSVGRMVATVYPHGEWIESHDELVRFRSGVVTYRMFFEMVRAEKLDEPTIAQLAELLLEQLSER